MIKISYFSVFALVFLGSLFSFGSNWAAGATTLVYNFSGPDSTLGTSQIYTVDGVSITASGFSYNNIPEKLYAKGDPGDEHGLGLANSVDHELQGGEFIQLDLKNILALNPTSIEVVLGSVHPGVEWKLNASNIAGSPGSPFQYGTADQTAISVDPSKLEQYLSFKAEKGNVLVSEIIFNIPTVTVPEPATLLLLGSGLALAAYKKRKVKAAM